MLAAAWNECFDGPAAGISPADADWFAARAVARVDAERRPMVQVISVALAEAQASPAARVRVMERVGSLAASPAWCAEDCGEATALAFTLAAIDAAACGDDESTRAWFRRAYQVGGDVPAGGTR